MMTEQMRSGTELIAMVPEGEKVVGMVVFKGQVIIAMTCGIYRVEGDALVPIPLVEVPVK